jgi:hypothetical protein
MASKPCIAIFRDGLRPGSEPNQVVNQSHPSGQSAREFLPEAEPKGRLAALAPGRLGTLGGATKRKSLPNKPENDERRELSALGVVR